MLRQPFILSILIIASLGTSCVSSPTKKRHSSEITRDMISKKQDTPKVKPVEAAAPVNTNFSDEASDFLSRHVNPRLILSGPDTTFLKNLSSKDELSGVEEAALAIGTFKAVLYRESGGFAEDDIGSESSNSAANNKPSSTDTLGPEVKRALNSLENNPLLGSAEVGRLAFSVIKSQPSASVLSAKLAEILRAKFQDWQQIDRDLGSNKFETATSDADDETNYAELNTGDLRMADAVLMEAQLLADQKQFSMAIKKMANIGRTNPLFEEAQVKIRSFANGAVQELRRKAARAYQSALPVSDPQAKAAYLNEAKKYLEEAIEEFPSADQLDIVQENLDIIQKDLARLDVPGEDSPTSME